MATTAMASTPRRRRPTSPAADGFGAALRALRERRGLSMLVLAAQAGLHYSTISRLEAGERPPTRPAVGKLATGLGLDGEGRSALYRAGGFLPPDGAADPAAVERLLRATEATA